MQDGMGGFGGLPAMHGNAGDAPTAKPALCDFEHEKKAKDNLSKIIALPYGLFSFSQQKSTSNE